MDIKEIQAAVKELRRISYLDPSEIDMADVAGQFRRIEKAGFPMTKNPDRRAIRERAFGRLERLKGWPMSESEERAKYLQDSGPFFQIIAIDARLAEEEQT